MGLHSEASLDRQFVEFTKVLNLYLNHFPRHEKYGLALQIRNAAYDVYGYIVESQKRYQKKTSLTNLDIRHEQLRMFVRPAHELEYFAFRDGERRLPSEVAASCASTRFSLSGARCAPGASSLSSRHSVMRARPHRFVTCSTPQGPQTMAYIIAYRKATDDWTTYTLALPDAGQGGDDLRCTELATIDGVTYVAIPDAIELPPQPEQIAGSVERVDIDTTLRAKLKAESLQCQFINQQVTAKIRERYSIDDEIKLLRTAPSAEFELWNEYVEECRAWGRAQKAALGL